MLSDPADCKDFSGHDAKDISWQSVFNTQREKKTNLYSQLSKPKHHLLWLTSSCNYEASGIPKMSSVIVTWQGPGNALHNRIQILLALEGSFPGEVIRWNQLAARGTDTLLPYTHEIYDEHCKYQRCLRHRTCPYGQNLAKRHDIHIQIHIVSTYSVTMQPNI